MPKLNTTVVIGWRNIGDVDSEVNLVEAPLSDVWKQLTHWMVDVTIAKRIDIVVGRNKAEVEQRFTTSRAAKESNKEVFMDEVTAMLERVPEDGNEEVWVPPRLGAKTNS